MVQMVISSCCSLLHRKLWQGLSAYREHVQSRQRCCRPHCLLPYPLRLAAQHQIDQITKMMYDGVRLAVFATIVAAALFDGTHATWNGSLDYKIQRVQTEHPTLDESREAAFEFFRGMAAVGYGQTAAVVFGAASIRHHFPDFRSTPVSKT